MKHLVGCAVTANHNPTIGGLSIEQWWQKRFYYVLKMSVNRASTTFGLASGKRHAVAATLPHNRAIGRLSGQKLLQQHRPKNERPRSVNNMRPSILENHEVMNLQ
jgi:hypothetical protein